MTANHAVRGEAARPSKLNIEAIARLEHEALYRRSATERASDAIVKFCGSVRFLLIQLFVVAVWIGVNLNLLPGVQPFDPFPFGVLALVVSAEAALLTIFVLVSQNRMTRQAEKRSHLDLQISMLAEQELTTLLQMQRKVCEKLGIDIGESEHELEKFADATDVNQLASDLEENLPE
jgi:uncharacterized membrane protein